LIDAQVSQCTYCGASTGPRAFRLPENDGLTSSLIPNGRMAVALLLLVNSALFIAIHLSGSPALPRFGTKWLPGILSGEWYRLITAGYLHTQFFHIFMNMMSLYNLGPIVEEIYGTRRMFTLYTVATVGGFFLSALWAPWNHSLGASAGIFGLLGALIAYGVHSKSFIAQHLRTQCLANAAVGLAMGWLLPMIDNAAHLGGLAGGFGVAYLAGLPQWGTVTKERIWAALSAIALLLTLLAFFQLALHISAGKAE
jgi:rhomboid protease GluP